jgi:hypothetical protein
MQARNKYQGFTKVALVCSGVDARTDVEFNLFGSR